LTDTLSTLVYVSRVHRAMISDLFQAAYRVGIRSSVYKTVRCPYSVRLCVQAWAQTAGLLLWAWRAGDIDRSQWQLRANAGSSALSASVGS